MPTGGVTIASSTACFPAAPMAFQLRFSRPRIFRRHVETGTRVNIQRNDPMDCGRGLE
jgi:hypothetical protein